MAPLKHARGFTLIELMIVVGIIIVLASVAFPMYTDYVLRSKLQEATSTLATMRVKAEQYFADNRTYVGLEANCANWSAGGEYFTYSCVLPAAPDATSYTFTATGNNRGTSGFVYTVDESNLRQSTIVAPAPPGWITVGTVNCWITRKGQTTC